MGIRLVDGLVVQHGDAPLIGAFVLQAYAKVQEWGLTLYWHDDMCGLVEVNRLRMGSWFSLPTMFDPRYHEVGGGRAAWIEARDKSGQSVSAIALRQYDWRGTNMTEATRSGRLFYADPARDAQPGEEWKMWALAADKVTGTVAYPGALWVRPDWRGTALAALMCHVAMAAAWTLWNPRFVAAVIQTAAVEKNAESQYGFAHVEDGASIGGGWIGERRLVLVWNSRAELARAVRRYYTTLVERTTEKRVATWSPVGVVQGSMRRS